MKKKVSVCIPCRNEVENVQPLAEELVKYMEQMPQFDFEVIFIDNCSTDGTQNKLREICSKETRIKAIFNAKNFPWGSGLHVLFQAQGDCIISIPADFQVPLDLIPKMIAEWENGAMVVALIKKTKKHDKIRLFRKLYYKMSGVLSSHNNISGFTGSGLYDKKFMNMCKTTLNDPFLLEYMVAHFASPLVKMLYEENPRRSGKSNNSFVSLIDIAIVRFVNVSDTAPRYAIIAGLVMGMASFLISIYYLVRKLLDWHHFPVGIAPLVIGMFFLASVQLIFIGIIGKYVITISDRQRNMPFVIEKERINFTGEPVN